jgi:putative acetyltransferase
MISDMCKLNIIIREIEENDNHDLAKIIRNVLVEHGAQQKGTIYSDHIMDNLYASFRKSGSILWVAVVESRTEGCCGIYPTEGLNNDCAKLVKFYLNPKFRGKGIGKKLMEKSIQLAKQWEYRYLYLESCPQFVKTINIYKKTGFGNLEHPTGKSNHCSCNIWMIKRL